MSELETWRVHVDLDAERAVLGAALQHETAFIAAREVLRDGACEFAVEKHGQLWAQIAKLCDGKTMLDGILIKDHLVRAGLFDELGGYNFLADLISAVPSYTRASEYARLVHESYMRRKLAQVCYEGERMAGDRSLTLDDCVATASARVQDILNLAKSHENEDLQSQVARAFSRMAKAEGGGVFGDALLSNFPRLDEIVGGFEPAHLILVAAPTSHGKTVLLLQIAQYLALDCGQRVLFFSLEMDSHALICRIVACRACVRCSDVRRGRALSGEQRKAVNIVRAELEAAQDRLILDERGGLSLDQIRITAMAEHSRNPLRAVIVDYVGLMRPPRAERREREIAQISSGLKALAKTLNVPVFAAVQIRRDSDSKSGAPRPPTLGSLKDSSAQEQDADVVILLYSQAIAEAHQAGRATDLPDIVETGCIVAKNREGPTGSCRLRFTRPHTRFDPIDAPAADEPRHEAGMGDWK